MDNDLMARRLRPPYQPTPANAQSISRPSPWDVQLTDDGSFAPNAATPPQQDPPFAPPDTATRADVPWDRPAPEAWPPTDDSGADDSGADDSGADDSYIWSAQPAPPALEPVLPAWPEVDPLGDAVPWDTPASEQSLDPDDAMAPVVADVDAAAGPWHEWTDSVAEAYAAAGRNGSGHADNPAGGANDFLYAITSSPEPMIVAAHGVDEPHGADEPPSVDEPRWDAWADAADTPPATSDGPVGPEYSWSPIPQDVTPPAPPSSWEEAEANPEANAEAQAEVVAEPTVHGDETHPAPPSSWEEAEANAEAQAEVVAEPTVHGDETHPAPPWSWEEAEVNPEAQAEVVAEPTVDMPESTADIPWPTNEMSQPEPEQAWAAPAVEPVPAPPVAPPPAVAPVIASAELVPSPSGSPQSMVLRIELAIVGESQRANPADAARRVGPEADVRTPEYDPRPNGDRAMPWPEYLWNVPPVEVPKQQRGPRKAEPRSVGQPAPVQPMQLDWDLPQISGPEPDQPAPWSTPQRQPQLPPPVAPPPTWVLTEPTPPSAPKPAQYAPPSAPRYQQPAWQPSQSTDPLHGLPAAPNQQPEGYSPAGYQPAPHSPGMPAQGQNPVPSVQPAPAAGWRARFGLPAAASAADDDAQPTGRSSSVMTAGLTIGFALLVIVLVLVFIQLMTSLLR